jgi:ribosomal protein S6--L-glutamate ligase
MSTLEQKIKKTHSLECDRTIGMWMYQNSGGAEIEQKIIMQLLERGINSVTGLNLRYSQADAHALRNKGINLYDMDLFFSYNAGEQTQSQIYFYEQLSRIIPTVNSFDAFTITEDKFKTNQILSAKNIAKNDFFLCHREEGELIRDKFNEWGKLVFKPVDGWGGVGMALIDSEATLDTIMPFLNQMDIRQYYVERYIDNDHTDFRIDIVDGEFIACYGRKASDHDWRTNITSGGKVILREANDDVVNLAKAAAKATGLDIAGVDLLYDREREEYVVLEVNGIPAFATPAQEKMGLNFNDKKIEKIVNLIDRVTQKNL